ncbi:uncharacterized protein LACBIDRAFT_334185 [Laccaria bicolor S238N-H82]|uniref:Predicted protein n=1 Tax=Laccaria bicolor (strain S238N-H82 / ATCC MYA-4686) TaxID=486041 RepID=B0DYD3_LACBS|nr:uncharacterized protein LACBIDRAFT_334185 [Laccaria bicolor S238N-H82]EDR00416.1 predicted protein [Laccaria bicolor S238N-H82]|eukprot:XP_001888975.1 predicted protein [Laccaria bicolor S238N-H82]
MANSVEIPQDIIDNVIVALGDDKRSLKQCALVSSSFLRPSRKQLFYSISFGSNVEACAKLHQALVQNPVNRSFVRRMSVNNQHYWVSHFDDSILSIVQLPFCHLEELSLANVMWGRFSGELSDALFTLIHSPTLKFLYLIQVQSVPLTLFHGIVHLRKLYLQDVWFDYYAAEQPRSLTPKGVATTSSHAVVDHCEWSFWDPTAMMSPSIMFRFILIYAAILFGAIWTPL